MAMRKKNPIPQRPRDGVFVWETMEDSSYSGCFGGVFFASFLSSFFLPSLSAVAGFSSVGFTGFACGVVG